MISTIASCSHSSPKHNLDFLISSIWASITTTNGIGKDCESGVLARLMQSLLLRRLGFSLEEYTSTKSLHNELPEVFSFFPRESSTDPGFLPIDLTHSTSICLPVFGLIYCTFNDVLSQIGCDDWLDSIFGTQSPEPKGQWSRVRTSSREYLRAAVTARSSAHLHVWAYVVPFGPTFSTPKKRVPSMM